MVERPKAPAPVCWEKRPGGGGATSSAGADPDGESCWPQGGPEVCHRGRQGPAGERRDALDALLRENYEKLFELNLKTATPGQVSDAIASYGPTGATRDRAVRFFLKAAYHCGIPLSSRLTAGMRSKDSSDPSDTEDAPQVTIPRRRRRRTSVGETPERHEDEISGRAVKTVSLRETGGTLTLSGTFNPFELDGDERKLVYDIIDLMKSYEQKKREG
jgi:hypothetical protein